MSISLEPDVHVSLIAPVYRNAGTVEELYRRAQSVFDKLDLHWELIYVNDACPAGSHAPLHGLARRFPDVAVVELTHNCGQHIAALVGLAHARGEFAVILDADLQDPPEAIGALLAAFDESTDVVFAGRRGRYESWMKLATSRLFKWTLHLACGVPRDAGMFVALSRRAVEALVRMPTRRPWIVAMIGCAGLKARSIPVTRSVRHVGSSAYSPLGRLRTALRALRCVAEHRCFPPSQPFPTDALVARRLGARFKAPGGAKAGCSPHAAPLENAAAGKHRSAA
jgi:hypothetical protein